MEDCLVGTFCGSFLQQTKTLTRLQLIHILVNILLYSLDTLFLALDELSGINDKHFLSGQYSVTHSSCLYYTHSISVRPTLVQGSGLIHRNWIHHRKLIKI